MVPELAHIEWEVLLIDIETKLDEIVLHLDAEYSALPANTPPIGGLKQIALGHLSDDELHYRVLVL